MGAEIVAENAIPKHALSIKLNSLGPQRSAANLAFSVLHPVLLTMSFLFFNKIFCKYLFSQCLCGECLVAAFRRPVVKAVKSRRKTTQRCTSTLSHFNISTWHYVFSPHPPPDPACGGVEEAENSLPFKTRRLKIPSPSRGGLGWGWVTIVI